MHFSPASHKNALKHNDIFRKWEQHSAELPHMCFDQVSGCRVFEHPVSFRVIGKPEKCQNVCNILQRFLRELCFPKPPDIDQQQHQFFFLAHQIELFSWFFCPECIHMIPAAPRIAESGTGFSQLCLIKFSDDPSEIFDHFLIPPPHLFLKLCSEKSPQAR